MLYLMAMLVLEMVISLLLGPVQPEGLTIMMPPDPSRAVTALYDVIGRNVSDMQ